MVRQITCLGLVSAVFGALFPQQAPLIAQEASADVKTVVESTPLAEALPIGDVAETAAEFAIEVRKYEVAKILDRLEQEAGINGAEAREWLRARLTPYFPPLQSESTATDSDAPIADQTVNTTESQLSVSGGLHLDSNGCGVGFKDGSLFVACPKDCHAQVSRLLATMTQFGIRQVIIRTSVYRGESAAVMQLPIKWSHIEALSEVAESPGEPVQAASAISNATNPPFGQPVVPAGFQPTVSDLARYDLQAPEGTTGETWTYARSITERSTPVLYTLMTPEERSALLDDLDDNAAMEAIMSPSVVVFNGQVATVSNSVERPFVTGIRPVLVGQGAQSQVDFAPKIRVYPEGTTMKMLPELSLGRKVRMNYHLEVCKIRNVETMDLPRYDGQGTFTIQMPEVATTDFRTRLDLPLGHSLVVTAHETDENGVSSSVLVICQCTVRDIEHLAPDTK